MSLNSAIRAAHWQPQARVDLSWQTLERIVNLVRRAGRAILACGPPRPDLKPDGSPVTHADHIAQEVICGDLSAWDEGVPIVAEESALPPASSRAGWTRYWLVDPLDGTKEYLAGRADYTVMSRRSIAASRCWASSTRRRWIGRIGPAADSGAGASRATSRRCVCV